MFFLFVTVCSNPVSSTGPKEIEEYLKIKGLVDKVSSLQSGQLSVLLYKKGYLHLRNMRENII